LNTGDSGFGLDFDGPRDFAERIKHRGIFRKHIGCETDDALLRRDFCQVPQQKKSDSAPSEIFLHDEGDFRPVRRHVAIISSDRNESLAAFVRNLTHDGHRVMIIKCDHLLQSVVLQMADQPEITLVNRRRRVRIK
jgi:hypothetical protein